MVHVHIKSDARYRVDRKVVRAYIHKEWNERELPAGSVSVSFVGTRLSRMISKEHLHDDEPHPVITLPYTEGFPDGLLAEIIICFPQVVLFAAEQDKEVDAVIRQFLNHALTIISEGFRKKQ